MHLLVFKRVARLAPLVVHAAVMALWLAASQVFAVEQTGSGQVDPKSVTLSSLNSMPLSFTQNKGQWSDSILYRANAGGATMWFTSNGAYYQFARRIPSADSPAIDRMRQHGPGFEYDNIETMMIKASFVGCNPNPQLTGDNLLDYKCNYFLGNDHSKWRTDVPNYSSVTYKEVYSGIDLKYYGDGRKVEYDFIVAPNADYSQIKINYEGAKSLAVNDNGDLVIETGWGTVTEKAPLVYQVDGEDRIQLKGTYSVEENGSFGFALGPEYNRLLPLVIDPVLSYSTYLGGSSWEICKGIAVDGSGSAYVTGSTYSSDFPTVTPFHGTLKGSTDVFVTKLSSGGNALVYSTYLGGSSSDDYGSGIAVDSTGSAYVTGWTDSPDFPTAVPFDGSFNGAIDAFVARLSPAGNSLVYSSYLGGSGQDYGAAIAIDGVGGAYVTGKTDSPDMPTVNPFSSSLTGYEDAFVTKVSPGGNSLAYSTYLGGSDNEFGYGIAADRVGSAYLTGWTSSSDFPTVTPFSGSTGGYGDAFVTKLSPAGNSLEYSTYLGGSGRDEGDGIVVDATGSAYVTGNTGSPDFPTANPYSGTFGGYGDTFVTKLSPGGNTLAYSTYLGNSFGRGIAVDGEGSAYVTGQTFSPDFPTVAPFDGSLKGGSDAFVTKLSPAGNTLSYSSYLGGIGDEGGDGIAVDGTGNAYVTGSTSSSDFPTATPFSSALNGASDAFVTKVSGSAGCCTTASTGDVDASGSVDIADLTAMVDFLFSSVPFPGTCFLEQDVDKSGSIDITDLQGIIDYLFNGAALRSCP
jgi:hypothetical protein